MLILFSKCPWPGGNTKKALLQCEVAKASWFCHFCRKERGPHPGGPFPGVPQEFTSTPGPTCREGSPADTRIRNEPFPTQPSGTHFDLGEEWGDAGSSNPTERTTRHTPSFAMGNDTLICSPYTHGAILCDGGHLLAPAPKFLLTGQ